IEPAPPSCLYAVPPRARMYLQPTSSSQSNSLARNQEQALISDAFGALFPGGRHLTTLVTKASHRLKPCLSNSLHRSLPDGPISGRPSTSSSAPGASAITANSGSKGPVAPMHTDIASLWSGQRSQGRSEEHTSELQSRENLVCRLL